MCLQYLVEKLLFIKFAVLHFVASTITSCFLGLSSGLLFRSGETFWGDHRCLWPTFENKKRLNLFLVLLSFVSRLNVWMSSVRNIWAWREWSGESTQNREPLPPFKSTPFIQTGSSWGRSPEIWLARDDNMSTWARLNWTSLLRKINTLGHF